MNNSAQQIDYTEIGYDGNKANRSGQRKAYLEDKLYAAYQSQRLGIHVEQSAIEQLPETYSRETLLGILIFLMLDALLTLSILGLATDRIVSLTDILLHRDMAIFFMTKSIVIAMFIGFVTVYKHYDKLQGLSNRLLLSGAGVIYLSLVACEIAITASF